LNENGETSRRDESGDTDPLDDVLADYLRAVERGETPDRDDLLARHLDLADELRQFFANHDRMKHVAQPLCEATATHPASDTAARIRYFGDYEVLEEIARGGMGVVFKARQVRLNRIVAVKMILSGQLASPEDVERFHTEAEAAAKLDHPGIVPIYEVGQHEGQHYFSMGFVDGQSLSTRVAQGPLPAREAAEILRTVANAVQYAHENGVVHRDLKPGNVLLDSHGQPRITDFGLAKLTESRSELTRTGQILGTPAYMPPEQAAAQASAVGHLSDIYSLGAILYCLLTGRPPFQAATPIETLLQVQKQEPVAPRQLNPTIPLDLDTIVLKCLEKSPARRYSTAQDVVEELQRFLDGRPIVARPVGSVERMWRWYRRNPVVAGLMTTVAVSLLAGTAVSTYFAIESGRRANENLVLARLEKDARDEADKRKEEAEINATTAEQHRIDAEKQRGIAQANEKEAKAQERLARRRFYAAQMNLAQQAWDQGHPARVLELLEEQRPKFDQEDLRTFEWYYLWRSVHCGRRFTLAAHTAPVKSVAFCPDGNTVASGSTDGAVKLWDLATRQVRFTFASQRSNSLAFSPDGKTLASAGSGPLVILWDVRSGRELGALHGKNTDWARSVAFSPDGNTLAAGNESGTVRFWDVPTQRERATLNAQPKAPVMSMAFSPDGKTLATAGAWNNGVVKLWDLGTEPPRMTSQLVEAWCLAFSPDGARLVTGTGEGSVLLWDVATGQELTAIRGQTARVASVAFSPDGKNVAFACGDRTMRLWESDTGRLWTHAHLGGVNSLAFSPDGKTLVSGSEDRTVTIWDAIPAADELTIQGNPGEIQALAYSPDGKTLVSTSADAICIWDTATGEKRTTLKSHSAAVQCLAFRLDGKTLASGDVAGLVKLWDCASWREQSSFQTHGQMIFALAFSPDGKTLASARTAQHLDFVGEEGPILRELATNKLQSPLKNLGSTSAVTYSPDGNTLVAANKLGTVRFLDLATGRAGPRLYAGDGWVWSLAFSPNGNTLATAADGGILKLWDGTSGLLRATLRGHTAAVKVVAYFPDGKTLASASVDGTVKLWDVVTGQERSTLARHGEKVISLAIAPDGTKMATGSSDGTIRFWLAPRDQEAVAHALADL
jgi:WD40 repeat protein/serine/threonine protein kinase